MSKCFWIILIDVFLNEVSQRQCKPGADFAEFIIIYQNVILRRLDLADICELHHEDQVI